MAPLRDKLKQSRPPNLRRGTARARCGICLHFNANAGTCRAYGGFPVRPTQVSDSWAPAAGVKPMHKEV